MPDYKNRLALGEDDHEWHHTLGGKYDLAADEDRAICRKCGMKIKWDGGGEFAARGWFTEVGEPIQTCEEMQAIMRTVIDRMLGTMQAAGLNPQQATHIIDTIHASMHERIGATSSDPPPPSRPS
jgi:hypothetical protein